MNKKFSTEVVVLAYTKLKDAKLTKMENNEKFIVIRAMRELKSIFMPFTELLETAREKLRPENWEEIQGMLHNYESLQPREKAAVLSVTTALDRRVKECVKEELAKEHEMKFAPLTEEAFGRLIASNDFDLQSIMALQDVLCD